MDDERKAVLWQVIDEGFGQGNLQVIDDLVAADFIEHQYNIQPRNREGTKECIRMLHAAFPDFSVTHRHATVDGELVWCHFTARGTHRGPLGPFPPTGKPMEIDVFDLARVHDGKIVEHWGVPDLFAQLEQLGLMGRREPARG